jgi:hypothetical protein
MVWGPGKEVSIRSKEKLIEKLEQRLANARRDIKKLETK